MRLVIFREAYKHFDRMCMLWSIGKDSTVLLWLARKAFYGHVPFPLVHIDTTRKIPEMIEFRDKVARQWNVRLIVGNEALLRNDISLEELMKILDHVRKALGVPVLTDVKAVGHVWLSQAGDYYEIDDDLPKAEGSSHGRFLT